MKFSTRDRYALRLMVELANRPNDLIPLKEISDKQRISLKYLEQIVTPLAKAGLVSSVRGAQGGYRLARSAAEITSGEILRAVEGELTAIPCLASSVDCPHRGQCHTLDFWSGLNDLINKYVDGITLEQLRTMPEVPEISLGTPERYHSVCKDCEEGRISAKNLKNKQKAIFLMLRYFFSTGFL